MLFVFLQSEQVVFHRVCHVALLADIHTLSWFPQGDRILMYFSQLWKSVTLLVLITCFLAQYSMYCAVLVLLILSERTAKKNINKLREKNSPFLC